MDMIIECNIDFVEMVFALGCIKIYLDWLWIYCDNWKIKLCFLIPLLDCEAL